MAKKLKEKALWPTESYPLDATAVARYQQILRVMRSAQRMSERGVRIDQERCRFHIKDAQVRIDRFTNMFLEQTGLHREALGAAGSGATKAVREWFWDECKAPKEVFDKHSKKPQFNTAQLINYASSHKGKPFSAPAAALYGIRKGKTAQRFARAYLDVSSQHDERIHFGFNVNGTKGERWSASKAWRWFDEGLDNWVEVKLNAQNVPSKEPKYKFGGDEEPIKLALSLRDCFIPDPGKVWLKFDGDQAEARCLAYTTGAKLLLDWIENGQDLHIEMAKRLFIEAKIPAEWTNKDDPAFKAYKKYRDGNKAVMYAFAYCFPNHKGETYVVEVYKQLLQTFPDIELSYVQKLCARYFEVLPEFRAWQNASKKQVNDTNKGVLQQNGRFLWLPATMHGYNMYGNFQMQSGYGFLMNRATPEVDRDLAQFDAQLLIQLHDELDIQAPENRVDEVCAMVSDHLSKPANFGAVVAGIPHKGASGPNWGSLKDR